MAKKSGEYSYKAGDKITIRQTRSVIARPKDQKDTLVSMGLGKIGHSTTLVLNPSLVGKLRKVWHMVSVES